VIAQGESPIARSPGAIVKYVAACLAGSVLCADIVGWGDNLLGLRPFSILGNVIVFNNMVSALVLSPLILSAVYPRVRRGRMLYADVLPEFKERRWSVRAAGLAMLVAGEAGAWLMGNLVSTGYWAPSFLSAAMTQPPYDKAIAIVVSPFILLAVMGVGLM
jgi:energy-coupling factor transport system substrate-specific component